MKWQGRRESDNVTKSSGGGSLGRGAMLGGLGLTGTLIVVVISLLLGQNPLNLLGDITSTQQPQTRQSETYTPRNAEEAELEKMLSVVFADLEDVWTDIFNSHQKSYKKPYLHLYQDTVRSGCGVASKNQGPFYCGADQTVYIDVSFAKQLRTTFGAKGDFPFVYVLAHEVGHHVQQQLGILQKVQGLRGRVSSVEFNKQMVNLELQADYFAGVFTNHIKQKGYLDLGDIEEGIAAASGVGDDRIQEMQGGQANPDTFQHGTSKQRQEWFTRGVKYGDIEHGNTFELVNN